MRRRCKPNRWVSIPKKIMMGIARVKKDFFERDEGRGANNESSEVIDSLPPVTF